jgi:hypothetical protein
VLRVIRPQHLNCNHEDLGKRWLTYEGPSDKSLGTGALAVRLRKLAIDGEKTLQEIENLHTSRASRCSAFSVEHRLDRTARTYLSFIGAPESDGLP